MNRRDLQGLARTRLREASILLGSGQFSGAYYLAGYAVECGFKAVIAQQFQRHEFPDKKLVNDSHTHNLAVLLRLAGLQETLRDEALADPLLDVSWAVVKDWDETSRYRVTAAAEARDLVSSVRQRHGVLPWITRRW
jgi:hypothetical protein